MKQPNLGYADVKLDFACMHPAGSACRVSLCVYYDLCALHLYLCSPTDGAARIYLIYLFAPARAPFQLVWVQFFLTTIPEREKKTFE